MRISDLTKGDIIKLENKIYEVVNIKHTHMGRGSANLTLVLKNVQTNQSLEKKFKPDENIEYLEVDKERLIFTHTDKNYFYFKKNDKNYTLSKNLFSYLEKFLKPDLEVVGFFDEENNLLWIELPKIIEYKVVSAPPEYKGGSVQRSYKPVKIETGYEVKAPFFIKEGDIIKVNTETGEYVERVQK